MTGQKWQNFKRNSIFYKQECNVSSVYLMTNSMYYSLINLSVKHIEFLCGGRSMHEICGSIQEAVIPWMGAGSIRTVKLYRQEQQSLSF